MPDLIDIEGTAQPDDWTAVADIADVEERFSKAGSIFEADLHRHLSTLKAQFEAGLSVNASEIDLPAPGIVARYLGLHDMDNISLEALFDGIRTLIERIGPKLAVTRLAGLPIDLPEDIIERLGAGGETALGEGASAQSALHSLFTICMKRKLGLQLDAQDVEAFVNCLGDGSSELFVSLVRHASYQAITNDDWIGLSPEGAVASCVEIRVARSPA